jgi:hypothetical protein
LGKAYATAPSETAIEMLLKRRAVPVPSNWSLITALSVRPYHECDRIQPIHAAPPP